MILGNIFEAIGKREKQFTRFWYDPHNREMHDFFDLDDPEKMSKYHFQYAYTYFDYDIELYNPYAENADDADAIHEIVGDTLDRGWVRGNYNGHRDLMMLEGDVDSIHICLFDLLKSGWFKNVKVLMIDTFGEGEIGGHYSDVNLRKLLTFIRTNPV
tara:strand:+ start:1273 stop:1743 length:471 start_codon:yes stop_codon:yes gene_type:complete